MNLVLCISTLVPEGRGDGEITKNFVDVICEWTLKWWSKTPFPSLTESKKRERASGAKMDI